MKQARMPSAVISEIHSARATAGADTADEWRAADEFVAARFTAAERFVRPASSGQPHAAVAQGGVIRAV